MADRSRRIGRVIGAACALLLVASGGVAGAAARTPRAVRAAVNPVFRPILSQLKGVLIPVLLPTYLPHQHDAGVHLSADVDDRSRWGYLVDIGYTPRCGGVEACRLGSVTGGAEIDTPTIFDYPRAHHARLRNGAQALFFPFQCGASCGDSVLVFQVDGIVYTVSAKAGSLQEVLAMANSIAAVSTS